MHNKRGQTRQPIIAAAYELFWRAGFARSSMDGIAAHAGLTKRTPLYSHFRSKVICSRQF
jgi:AcrR family transcriptional regulator